MRLLKNMSYNITPKNLVIFFIIVLIVIGSIFIYNMNVSNALEHSVSESLTEVVSQQKHVVSDEIDDILVRLHGVSGEVSTMYAQADGADTSNELHKILEAAALRTDFTDIIVTDAQGKGLNSNGSEVDISQMSFFNSTMQGAAVSSDISFYPQLRDESLYISIPILENSIVVGVVAAEISTSMFEDLLLPSYHGEGVTVLLGSDGKVLAATSNSFEVSSGESIYDTIPTLQYQSDVSATEFSQILSSEHTNGYMSYSKNDVPQRLTFAPLEDTGWTMLVSVPEEVLTADANIVLKNTGLLVLEIALIITILWLRIFFIRKNAFNEVAKAAYYDDLTNLKNEKKFKLDIKETLKENPDVQFSIIKIDIIGFNIINKLYDFETGNNVIKAVAELEDMLKSMMKDDNLVCARFVADEFLIFGKSDKLHTIGLGRKVFENVINEKISKICKRSLKLRYSRYLIPLGEDNVDEIVDMVTLTHSASKKISKDIVYDYDDNLKDALVKRTLICDTMHDALKNREFKVYLQPKNCLVTGEVCGAEALVRWQKADGKLVFPGDFIPIFEQEGFIVELDKYMLKEVCKIIRRFEKKSLKQIPVSVNFSRLHMMSDHFVEEVTHIVDSTGVPRHLIELEMTETSLIENESEIKSKFEQLQQCGFSLSMDDFGAGYSSLDLLSDLSFNVLKLDKSLLSKSDDSEKKRYVISTILNMSKGLSIKTVCEGVETLEQVEFLRDAGCDLAQGYYFSRPIPHQDFDELLQPVSKSPAETNRLQFLQVATMEVS